jgi:hypothetical protein
MPELYINMSDKVMPVYQDYDWTNPGPQIGSIYKREVFSFQYGEAGSTIVFRNSSGRVTTGFLPILDKNGNDFFDRETEKKMFTSCTALPYDTVTINGASYVTFKFRRSEEVYTAAGTRWGTVAAGMRVACRSDATGESHPDWKLINFVERSTDGEWIPVTGDGYQHGFVDIGLNQGSTPSSISMYGSW